VGFEFQCGPGGHFCICEVFGQFSLLLLPHILYLCRRHKLSMYDDVVESREDDEVTTNDACSILSCFRLQQQYHHKCWPRGYAVRWQ